MPDHVDAGQYGDPDKYSTKLFRERAVDIVGNHSLNYPEVPLFLYLPFQAVHSPLQSAPYWQKQFNISDFGGDKNRWTLAAMVLEMDHAVDKVVQSFHDTGLYNSTIFVLSADNGGISSGGGYNWPYRGEKATWWEGGCRAVGFVHSALLPRTGFTYHGLVHVTDWLPTFVHLAGGDVGSLPAIDGHDVWGSITTNTTSPRTELLYLLHLYSNIV